jgi:4-hydroxybenzoyl-CoA thioesterase
VAQFIYQQKVMFQHCDPAGIVFYPRYFEMLNSCVESWFDTALNYSFATMHLKEKVGVPTVSLHSDFVAPSFLEDQLEFALSVREIGAKSIKLNIEVSSNEQLRFKAQVTLVFVNLAQSPPKSIAWHPVLKTAFDAYLETSFEVTSE